MIQQIIGGMASAGMSYLMSDALGEEPDYSAITASTGDAISDLQGTYNYLTKSGGGFEQKAKVMGATQESEIGDIINKFQTELGKQHDKGQQLIGSLGFSGAGIAEKSIQKDISDTADLYRSTAASTAAKHQEEQYDFRMDKFEVLSQIQKEMNEILGTYASTTGKQYHIQDISGLNDYRQGLLP